MLCCGVVSGLCRCGNVAAILELDEHLEPVFKVGTCTALSLHWRCVALSFSVLTDETAALRRVLC